VLATALQQARDARLQILEVMNKAIAEPRPSVAATAPKIVSFEIPMDKIGEVIGPKGKVINTIQQETGADINVDDDGVVGTVTIGSKEGEKVEDARRRIELILDPPKAEIGVVYNGKVVNITKFGAFVNILPGRDGLVHISKLGRGKRVERVEDVVNLGDDLAVRVDDIDPQGKVSLTPVGDGDESGGGQGGGDREPAPVASPRQSGRPDEPIQRGPSSEPGREYASFEDSFEAQAKERFGDLGPADAGRGDAGDGGGRPRRNQRRRGPGRR
jgi:polyribonucleotide nucleotidyltransferase